VTLRGEIVDLVRLHELDDADQVRRVGEIAVVQEQLDVTLVRVLVQVIDAIRVERGRTSLDAVHLVSLAEQQLREIGAVLARDTGDECFLAHKRS
jgi:hypothetical protein